MVSRYLTPSEKAMRDYDFQRLLEQEEARRALYKVKRPTGKDLLIMFGIATGSICVTVWIVWVTIDYAVRSLFGQ